MWVMTVEICNLTILNSLPKELMQFTELTHLEGTNSKFQGLFSYSSETKKIATSVSK